MTLIVKLVKKINTIKIPQTVKSIEQCCFLYVQDGKVLNIPQGVVDNLVGTDLFLTVKWKELIINPKNPKYKVKNGCLLSKDGNVMYGIVEQGKKIIIPNGVKTLSEDGDYNGPSIIIIPKSVIKIKGYALTTRKPVTIQIDAKNKNYAVKKGSVYSKRTGRLVAGYINKQGVLDVPNTVKTMYKTGGYLGDVKRLKKVIVPASVKEIGFFSRASFSNNVIFLFKGTTPPELPETYYLFEKSTIYVPKKCKAAYIKKWKKLQEEKYSFTIIEN